MSDNIFLNFSVPKKTNSNIELLLTKINSLYKPQYISVKIEKDSKIKECFDNVKKKVKKDGGKIIYGWEIKQTPIITEAMFHAVWESSDKKLWDITPKSFPMNKILFVIDLNNKYIGFHIDNIRINNTKNKLVDDLIFIKETLFNLLNRNEKTSVKKVKLSKQKAALIEYFHIIKIELEKYIYRGANNSSLCFCRSNKKYVNCHGEDLRKAIELLLLKYECFSN